MILLVNNVHEKTTESQSRRNFESVRALFVICTRVIILHLRYMRMHSFSANQKRVIFLVYIIYGINKRT